MEPHILERAEHPISRRDIDPDVLKVLYRLITAGQMAYLVGGSVRDLMLGRRPKDFDIATDAHPQRVRDLFRNSRLIGRRFRLVHVFFGPKNIEVATFRKQAEGVTIDDPLIRHDNTFGTPEEDAFRRDFTVNSLFYDPRTFRVIDYAGGVADLRARLIRTIGDPELRMREDPVRMMRAVRFAAKLGFEIEPATLAAIERHRSDLLKAAMPRLVEETYRTIGQTGAARALVLMEELGLLEQLAPWLSEHLRAEARPLIETRTVRNLAALGETISTGITRRTKWSWPRCSSICGRREIRANHRAKCVREKRGIRSGGRAAPARLRARRHRIHAADDRGVPAPDQALAPHAKTDPPAVLRKRAPAVRAGRRNLRRRYFRAGKISQRPGSVPARTHQRAPRYFLGTR